jgi:hypothetical protein
MGRFDAAQPVTYPNENKTADHPHTEVQHPKPQQNEPKPNTYPLSERKTGGTQAKVKEQAPTAPTS